MKITKRKLQSMGACTRHVELFAATFPTGTYVTLESLAKAREAGLDIDWFADNVPDDRRDEYECVMRPAWAAYNRIWQPARAAYNRIAWAEATGDQTGTAQAEYKRVWQSARDEYEKARDAALVAAFAD